MSDNTMSISLVAGCCVLLASSCIIGSSLTCVPAGHTGVASLFGKIDPKPLPEGMSFVNPFKRVYKVRTMSQTYTMSATHSEGAATGDDSIRAISSDGLTMPMDLSVVYRVLPDDAPMMKRWIMDYEADLIRPAARTAVRTASGAYTANALYSTARDEVAGAIKIAIEVEIAKVIRQYSDIKGEGVSIQQIFLRNISMPDQMKVAIESKQAAEQESEKMKFVLLKEKQEAERKRIEAQGISDFQKIVSQGIDERLLRWKGVEATENLAKSQNAKIVIIGAGLDGLPVILNTGKVE